MDVGGEMIWERTFQFSNGNDVLTSIITDSDNNLVGNGYSGTFTNSQAFVFKYDPINNVVLWVKYFSNTSLAYKVIEPQANGDYLVILNLDGIIQSSDGGLVYLDRNTGALSGNLASQYDNVSGADSFEDLVVLNGNIYTTGRYTNGTSTGSMRWAISKFDLNGNEQWSNLSFVPLNQQARLYPKSMIEENGALYSFGNGDDNGTSSAQTDVFLQKNDLDGNILWVKKYNFPTFTGDKGEEIVSVPDGFLLFGKNAATFGELYILKTDKNGNPIWAKNYGGAGHENVASKIDGEIFTSGGFVYFTAETNSYGNSSDILLVKTDSEGNLDDTCIIVKDIDVIMTEVNNPSNNNVSLNNNTIQKILNDFQAFPSDIVIPFESPQGCECDPPIDTCQNGALLNQVPDAELQFISASCNGENKTINIQICNNDSIALPINTPISFYNNDPTLFNAPLINTVLLYDSISPNNCDLFSYEINILINQEIYAVVNDDGTTVTPFDLNSDFPNTLIDECDFTNNINSFIIDFTSPPLDLGPDVSVCDFGVVDLDAGAGFISYNWSDATTEQATTAWQPGVYWVEATDSCSNVHTDSILLEVNPSSIVEIGMDTVEICEGEEITFSINGFNTYQWLPDDFLNCNDCPSVTATPDTTVTYILVAENGNGCISEDSVTIIVGERFSSSDDLFICAGDSVSIFGNFETAAGLYENTFTAVNGCDSIVEFNLIVFDAFLSTEIIEICANETADVFGTPTNIAGVYSENYNTVNGCDSIFLIELIVHDVYSTEETLQLCSGDSVLIFGDYETAAGVYADDYSSINGCDSSHQITLVVADTLLTNESVEICVGEMADVFGSQINTPGIYSENYITQSGCDSTHVIELVIRDTFSTGEILEICDGDSIVIFGNYEAEAGFYTNSFSSVYGCDSVHQVELIVLDTFFTDEELEICAGETIDIFGVPANIAGIYSEKYTAANGCDSTHVVNLVVRDTFLIEEFIEMCAGDPVLIFGNYETQAGVYAELNQTISGCDSLSIVYLETYEEMKLDMELTPTCANSNKGMATVNIVSGGTAPFNYNWNIAGTTNSATITNLSIGEYFVTITDANNCTAFAMGEIEELLEFNTDLIATDVTCATYEDGMLEIVSDIDSVAYSLDGFVYQTGNIFEGLATGEYNLIINDLMSGCSIELMFSISAPPPVNVVLPSDVTIELGEEIFINSTTSQNVLEYNWMPDQWLDCNDCPDVSSQPETTILYALNVFDENNCVASDSILITVELNPNIFMPTAFSPNNDGINDVFFPNTKGVAQIKLLRIFNRWGGQIYEKTDFAPNDPTIGWDGTFKGKVMNPAVFAYFMEVIYVDGSVGRVEGDLMLVK